MVFEIINQIAVGVLSILGNDLTDLRTWKLRLDLFLFRFVITNNAVVFIV